MGVYSRKKVQQHTHEVDLHGVGLLCVENASNMP